MTPESSGRGLSHSTFFKLVFTFYATIGCAAKMPLASASAGSSRQVTYFEVYKASLAAAGTI